MEQIKYRAIKSSYGVIVILEDGGIADIHTAEPYYGEPNRKSTTEYYQSKFTNEGLESADGVWDEVGKRPMYYNNWNTSCDNPDHITDALNWLAPGYEHILDEGIWPNFKG